MSRTTETRRREDRTQARQCRTWIAALGAVCAIVTFALAPCAVAAPEDNKRCTALRGLNLPQVRVLDAAPIGRGTDLGASVHAPVDLCRVRASATTSPSSRIGIEIWLPSRQEWNGKFLGTGNGGAGGRILPGALADGVVRGYATVNSDLGTGAPASPEAFRALVGKPEVQRDLTDRGVHVMTEVGKQVARAYYARGPAAALFAGCSAGGGEGLTEALAYPGDYDGIVIGDPPIDVIFEGFLQGKVYADSRRDPASIIPRESLPAIAQAVLSACDGLDGVVDGLIADPRRCLFDPGVLHCKAGAETPECLTPPQVAALRRIYDGLRGPSGELLYAGFSPGAEATSGALARIAGLNSGSAINPATPGPLIWSLRPGWTADDWLSFDFKTQMMPIADHAGGPTGTDLRGFAARGGKLIVYSGWHDALQNPAQLAVWYERMEAGLGGPSGASGTARMFLFPGMGHCGGGVGPNFFLQSGAAGRPPHLGDPRFDVVAALDAWVRNGEAPQSLMALKYDSDNPHGQVLRSRPACAYPAIATWSGRGSPLDGTSYVCKTE